MPGCGRRKRAPPQAAAVCPISGQTSSTGVCPMSGQAAFGAKSAKSSERKPLKPKQQEPLPEKQAADDIKSKWNDPLMGAKSQADAETAQELKEQGNQKFKSKSFEEALELYNEAVQLQPRDPSIWLNRSIVNRQLENWSDAEDGASASLRRCSPTIRKRTTAWHCASSTMVSWRNRSRRAGPV